MKAKISFILALSLSLFTNLALATPIIVCDLHTRVKYRAEIKNNQFIIESSSGGNRSTFVYNVFSGPTPASKSYLKASGLSTLEPNATHSSLTGPRKIISGVTYTADMNTNKSGDLVLREIGIYTANDGADVILIWGTVLDSAHCLMP